MGPHWECTVRARSGAGNGEGTVQGAGAERARVRGSCGAASGAAVLPAFFNPRYNVALFVTPMRHIQSKRDSTAKDGPEGVNEACIRRESNYMSSRPFTVRNAGVRVRLVHLTSTLVGKSSARLDVRAKFTPPQATRRLGFGCSGNRWRRPPHADAATLALLSPQQHAGDVLVRQESH